MKDKVIFHVGISKTGSTFYKTTYFILKSCIICPPTGSKNIFDLKNLQKERVLVSRELDRQFEAEIVRFSSQYKNVTPIIVLRKHDEYFASQYRRFIKNGFKGKEVDFLSLKSDTGFFKKFILTLVIKLVFSKTL